MFQSSQLGTPEPLVSGYLGNQAYLWVVFTCCILWVFLLMGVHSLPVSDFVIFNG